MNRLQKLITSALFVQGALMAATPAGLWDGVIRYDKTEIPFRFEISGSGDAVQGSFFNGEIPVVSSSGRLKDGKISLNFDHLGSRLEAGIDGDAITGTFGGKTRGIP